MKAFFFFKVGCININDERIKNRNQSHKFNQTKLLDNIGRALSNYNIKMEIIKKKNIKTYQTFVN